MEKIDGWYQRCQKAVFLNCDVDGSRCVAERLCRGKDRDLTTVATAVQLMDQGDFEGLEKKIGSLQKDSDAPELVCARLERYHQARIMTFVRDKWSST